MTRTERIALHSSVGRALMLAGMCASFAAMTSPLVILALSALRGELLPAVYAAPLQFLIGLLLFSFTRRNAIRAYMTGSGLELGSRRRVPWANVAGFQELGSLGGILARLCRFSFRDGSPSLVLYVRYDAIEEIRARLRDAHSSKNENTIESAESAAK